MSREQAVSAALVELADTLVVDFDIADFLYTLAVQCVDLDIGDGWFAEGCDHDSDRLG